MVRAKFFVKEVRYTETDGGGEVELEAVVDDGSDVNKKFFDATPWGSIRMGIINKDAIKEFVNGKEYYVDFTLAK